MEYKQPKLEWRQLQGKKDKIGEFIDEETDQHVHRFYMHNGIMPMELSIETLYNAFGSIKNNRKAKNTSNRKALNVIFVTSELLKLKDHKLVNG